MTDEIIAKLKLAVRWGGAGLALIILSCMATIFSPVVQGAVLLAAAVAVAIGVRHGWEILQKSTGKAP